jgi:hypothetical protein
MRDTASNQQREIFMTGQERIHALEVFKDMVENPLIYTECKESDLLIAIEALEQAKPTVQN